MSPRPRAVFFGTPTFAVPSLLAVAELTKLVGVVCQPDKPVGRGHVIQASPVKLAAVERGMEVYQPARVRDGALATWLTERAPDIAVVVAYGRILPVEVLAVPRLGCVNVHGSVLPRHRGAAPVQWAVLSGDTESGVTLMQMDAGMDTGPVLSVRRTAIGPDETAGELSVRLSALGADILRDDLGNVLAGALIPLAQDSTQATAAPLLTRDLSPIDWKRPAWAIHHQVRGLYPWPGSSTRLGAHRLIVGAMRMDAPPATVLGGAPGEIVAVTRDRVWVATGDGVIALTEVQLEGRKAMTVQNFLVGHPLRPGTLLGQDPAG